MAEIIINTQKELDAVKIDFDGIIKIFGVRIIVSLKYKYRVVARENSSVVAWENSSVVAWGNSSVEARENSSVEARENSSVEAWENSSVEAWENSSVEARENSSVEARENSSVEARENSSVEARENSSVVARENSSVEARGNSSVVARENSSVVARENSSVEARENSSVEAWENSSVVAWGNSSVVARENSSVEARENSSVEARGNVCVRIFSEIKTLSLFGFSVLFQPFDLKFKFKKEKTCLIRKFKTQKYLDREGIKPEKGFVVLYKKVSKDFYTQENSVNQTLWNIGSTVTHPDWRPTIKECGEGKFHACSRPYFCDEFRDNTGERYIAVKIKVSDLYEWKTPSYPHKIAFREGTVLYECNKYGKKIQPHILIRGAGGQQREQDSVDTMASKLSTRTCRRSKEAT